MKIETQIKRFKSDWRKLLAGLKPEIQDDYRCSDEPDDETPGMQVTIGFTPGKGWHYQTGDNSYSGGAYGHPHWAVISLYRRSNCAELANEIESQLLEAVEN